MNPFDFVNSVTFTKKNLLEENPGCEAHYVPFVVNRALSYFPDTIVYAETMNRCSHIDPTPQYLYLLNSIRPSRRFSKWTKREENEDLDIVKQYYGYSNEKAMQALRVLTSEQLQQIKQRLERGGVNEKPRDASGGPTKAG